MKEVTPVTEISTYNVGTQRSKWGFHYLGIKRNRKRTKKQAGTKSYIWKVVRNEVFSNCLCIREDLIGNRLRGGSTILHVVFDSKILESPIKGADLHRTPMALICQRW